MESQERLEQAYMLMACDLVERQETIDGGPGRGTSGTWKGAETEMSTLAAEKGEYAEVQMKCLN